VTVAGISIDTRIATIAVPINLNEIAVMAKKDTGKSKADMVRETIEKLGWDAGINEYQAYIKQTYGVEMSKPHISQTKSNERKRQGIRGRRRRRGRRPGGVGAPVAAGNARVADILSFVDTVRQWEAKIGAAGIREVVKTVLRK
jgi:hypothetical protein